MQTISDAACRILSKRLESILDIHIQISPTLGELASPETVTNAIHTRKCSKMEDHQVKVVECLLRSNYTDHIACTTFTTQQVPSWEWSSNPMTWPTSCWPITFQDGESIDVEHAKDDFVF